MWEQYFDWFCFKIAVLTSLFSLTENTSVLISAGRWPICMFSCLHVECLDALAWPWEIYKNVKYFALVMLQALVLYHRERARSVSSKQSVLFSWEYVLCVSLELPFWPCESSLRICKFTLMAWLKPAMCFHSLVSVLTVYFSLLTEGKEMMSCSSHRY